MDSYKKLNEHYILDEKRPLEHFLNICESVRYGYLQLSTETKKEALCSSGEIFCRGEPEFFEKSFLTPKIFRKENLKHEEAELISDFKATFSEYEKEFSSEIDWLSLMQHNGVPTRLLDWTINPLIALYFALGNKAQYDKDGIVFIVPIGDRLDTPNSEIIQPIRLSVKPFIKFYTNIAVASSTEQIAALMNQNAPYKDMQIYPDAIEVFPPNSHPRIKAQFGRFTIYYPKYIKEKQVLPHTIDHYNSYFFLESYRIRILKKTKELIKKQLRLMNIHEFILFPDKDKFFQHFVERKSQKLQSPIKNLFTKMNCSSIGSLYDKNKVIMYLVNQPENMKIVNYLKDIGFFYFFYYILKDILNILIEISIDENSDDRLLIKDCLNLIFKLINALDTISKESKANAKIILEHLINLETENSCKILSKTIKITKVNHFNLTPDLNFNSEDNLLLKAIKQVKKNQTSPEKKKTETVQASTERVTEDK